MPGVGQSPKGPVGTLVIVRANRTGRDGPIGFAIAPLRKLLKEVPIKTHRNLNGFNPFVKSDIASNTDDRKNAFGVFATTVPTKRGMGITPVLIVAEAVTFVADLGEGIAVKHDDFRPF